MIGFGAILRWLLLDTLDNQVYKHIFAQVKMTNFQGMMEYCALFEHVWRYFVDSSENVP